MHSTTLWKCSIFYRGKNLPAAIVSPRYKEDLSLGNNERASLFSWHRVSAPPCLISVAIDQCWTTLQKWWDYLNRHAGLLLTLTNMHSSSDRAITWSRQCRSQTQSEHLPKFSERHQNMSRWFKGNKSGFRWIHLQMMPFMLSFLQLSGWKVWDFALLFFHPFKWSQQIDGMTSRAKPAAQCKGHAAHWSRGPLIETPCIMGLRTRSLTHTEP